MEFRPKKYYSKPSIGIIKLDKVVSLSYPSKPFEPPSAVHTGKDSPSFGPSSVAPSGTSNPFGGSTPDYGDM